MFLSCKTFLPQRSASRGSWPAAGASLICNYGVKSTRGNVKKILWFLAIKDKQTVHKWYREEKKCRRWKYLVTLRRNNRKQKIENHLTINVIHVQFLLLLFFIFTGGSGKSNSSHNGSRVVNDWEPLPYIILIPRNLLLSFGLFISQLCKYFPNVSKYIYLIYILYCTLTQFYDAKNNTRYRNGLFIIRDRNGYTMRCRSFCFHVKFWL